MRCLYCTFWNPVTPTREKRSYPSLPLYIPWPEREGLQGGMYRDPACSLKLNTDNSEDTSRCISTDTHDMHSKRDFRELSNSCFLYALSQRTTKKLIPLKKNCCLYGPRSVYSSGSVNFPFTGENKKKAERHYYSYWENGLNMEVDGSYLIYFFFFFKLVFI